MRKTISSSSLHFSFLLRYPYHDNKAERLSPVFQERRRRKRRRRREENKRSSVPPPPLLESSS
jgi:hypothetical protein